MTKHTGVTAGTYLFCLLIGVVSTSQADEIKDRLDQANTAYSASIEKAVREATDSFDKQIRLVSQTGDLDAVQQLRAERSKFVASRVVPTSSVMREQLAKYQEMSVNAEARLRTAYEAAVSEYTKAGRFDDAEAVKRAMAERFLTTRPNPATTRATRPTDPILESLQSARLEFVRAVAASHAELLGIIDEKAKAASASGDLESYKTFAELHARVQGEMLVPDSVKDDAIRGANTALVRVATTEYEKLRLAFQAAIRDYTKTQRIDEAQAIKVEMDNGGWYETYARHSGRAVTINLLETINIARDTLRARWHFDNGVLEPAGWDVDNGPLIQVPVSVKGSYELRVSFTLGRAGDDIFFLVPVAEGSGLLCLRSNGQSFEDVEGARQSSQPGQLTATQTLALGVTHEASFRVTTVARGAVKIVLTLNGQQTISWAGDAAKVKKAGEMWRLDDRSCFGIVTKYGKVRDMKLIASSSVITHKKSPTQEGDGGSDGATVGPPKSEQLAVRELGVFKEAALRARLDAEKVRREADVRFKQSDQGKAIESELLQLQQLVDALRTSDDAKRRFEGGQKLFEVRKRYASTHDAAIESDEKLQAAKQIEAKAAGELAAAQARVQAVAAAQAAAENAAVNKDPVRRGLRDKKIVIGMTRAQVEQVLSGLTIFGGKLVSERDGGVATFEWKMAVPVNVVDDGWGFEPAGYLLRCTFENGKLSSYSKLAR